VLRCGRCREWFVSFGWRHAILIEGCQQDFFDMIGAAFFLAPL
jgi:hypothetical protein